MRERHACSHICALSRALSRAPTRAARIRARAQRVTGADGASWGVPADTGVLDAFDSISTMTFAYQGQSMLFEIASEMSRGDEFALATLAANGSLLAVYLSAMAVGYAYMGRDVAGFLPDSVADGPTKTAIGALLYFHVMITCAARAGARAPPPPRAATARGHRSPCAHGR